MCGIVGYVGGPRAKSIVLDGLKRLEYRGYDSCGIAVTTKDGLDVRRVVGGLSQLAGPAGELPDSDLAVGHTRWATHGGVTEENAHPHTDCQEQLVLVHNGVLENFTELRNGLGKAHKMRSQTDSEILAHVIESEFQGDLFAATRAALRRVRGTFAIVVAHRASPGELVFARRGAPLLVGVAREGHLIASDPTAILGETRTVVALHDGDVGRVRSDSLEVHNLDTGPATRPSSEIAWTAEQAEKGGFEHYMLKEIFEAPKAVRETTLGRLRITPPLVQLEGLSARADWSRVPRVRLLAAGSSYHAALIGKHFIETLAKIPCEATLASEYRESPPIEERGTVAVAVSQSGETADTLGALKEAKRRGLETVAIVNVEGSTATREADHVLLTRAGPEVGVAATKTYIAQLTALALFAIHLGEATRRGDPRELRSAANSLKQLPHALETVLQSRDALKELAGKLKRTSTLFFLGRGVNQAAALEAALKVKEVAYVHAEGYSTGELKHGPFALLTKKTPVIFLLPRDGREEQLLGTVLEVKSRGAPVYGITLGGPQPWGEFLGGFVDLPAVAPVWSPFLFGLATHLLAYEAAHARDCPIDRPRNLAKSVTVE